MRRDVKSLTVMVCTYRRPRLFARCMSSVAGLEIPDGFRLTVVAADNNPASERDGYVAAALAALTARNLPVVYGHQPERGYSNARNLALELALSTQSEIFAFVDDDLVLDPGWLAGQIRTYREFDCDCVGGAVIGPRKVPPHGSSQRASSMANFSFDRALVETGGGGLGLRFDPAKNVLGNEDLAFSTAATAAGRRMICSDWPVVIDHPTESAAGGDTHASDMRNRAAVAIAMTRNRVVGERQAGKYAALALSVLGAFHCLLKAIGLSIERAVWNLLGKSANAEAKAVSAWKEFGKFWATLAGLTGDVIARQDVRRSE